MLGTAVQSAVRPQRRAVTAASAFGGDA